MDKARPTIVGVAGGSGSGKTTVTQALMAHLGDDAVLLQHDWYYREQSDVPAAERSQVNYDHPDAQETELLTAHVSALRRGESIVAPQYDFSAHTRSRDTLSIAPKPVIVVEGINTLASEALCVLFDLTVFVDAPADIRFIRRLERDVENRGRTQESVITQYLEQVRPMHEAFVEPCKMTADLVLSGEADVEKSVANIAAHISSPSIETGGQSLLLLSNSTMAGEPYLGWAKDHIAQKLVGIDEVLFVPYAAVDIGNDTYTAMVSEVLSTSETRITGIHTIEDKVGALSAARCVIVGGGNTFSLLSACQREGLMAPLREAIRGGAVYVGWSAGANLACPTIKTTNDMPIESPSSFDGLGLVPFQINPHYTGETADGHGGESRDQRIKEFVLRNPSGGVLGLPEGMFVSVDGSECALRGDGEAMWFAKGRRAEAIVPGSLPEYARG